MFLSCVTPVLASNHSQVKPTDSDEKTVIDGVDVTVDIDEEINRALNGITDLKVLQKDLNELVSANIIDENGNAAPAEVYSTTREIKLPKESELTNDSSKIYATTSISTFATNKSDTDSANKYYVTAYGTIYWKDNRGTKNEFISASGGWSTDVDPSTKKKPSLSNILVTMEGYNSASETKIVHFYPGKTFTLSKSDFNYTYFKFSLHTYVTVNSKHKLELHGSTSMFT